MRVVVGVLLAAAIGIHCSAPTEAPPSSSSDVVAPPGAASGAARPRPAPAADPPEQAAPHETQLPALDGIIHDPATVHVTSTLYDPDGALFATGTFLGSVRIGNTVIQSRGDKDVFLLKLDARGAFDWVKSVGSAAVENAPRVSLEDSKVTIVGITKGELDCGGGPLPTWSSETFFLCTFTTADGKALSGGVFPTGSP